MYIFYFDFTACHIHDDDAFEAYSVRLTAQPGNCIKRHKAFTILEDMT